MSILENVNKLLIDSYLIGLENKGIQIIETIYYPVETLYTIPIDLLVYCIENIDYLYGISLCGAVDYNSKRVFIEDIYNFFLTLKITEKTYK